MNASILPKSDQSRVSNGNCKRRIAESIEDEDGRLSPISLVIKLNEAILLGLFHRYYKGSPSSSLK